MSVEALVIAALVEEGSVKKAYQSGVGQDDFEIHDDEWLWLCSRAERRKPINVRLFKKAFPEFDFILPRERLKDLLDELKQERAYIAISSGIEEVLSDLTQENAVEHALRLRELMGEALKIHAPNSDAMLKGDWQAHLKRMKQLSELGDAGEVPGIPTGIPHFDHHFGGMQGETTYLFLGRPGDAKSMTLGKIGAEGAWAGHRIGLFSPEMTEHQHRCRMATLWSAKKEIQEALGLSGAFRNRALKDGRGFNRKTYARFLKWMDDNMKGEVVLFNQKYRRKKMSPAYIESKIEDYGLDMIIVDPLYKLQSPTRRMSRWEELGEITDSLTDLAHAYNIPVILSNQANRALVGNKGDAPDKGSSFGSDAPVQEADCVIGVKHFSEEHTLVVNCSKNRHGEAFKFKMKFLPNVGVMEDVTPLKGDYLNGYDGDKVNELRDAMREVVK
jgi:hypothetical protein